MLPSGHLWRLNENGGIHLLLLSHELSVRQKVTKNNVLALVAVDEIRELDSIADEEDGEVQTAHVVVSFFGVVLDTNH